MMTEVKIAAIVLVLIGAVALGIAGYHKVWNSGYDAGFDKEKLELDAYIKTATDAATAVAEKNAAELTEATRNTQEQHDAYETQLATVNATAANITERLRRALAARPVTSGGPVPGHTNRSDDIPPGKPDSIEQLNNAITAAVAECLGNDDALDAVYNGLAPQIAAQSAATKAK
jgi:hypothetical protein